MDFRILSDMILGDGEEEMVVKRKSSEESPGESESSGSMSSQSENYSEEHQEFAKGSPNSSSESPEIMSKETGDEYPEEMIFTSDTSLLEKNSEADQEKVSSKSTEKVSISDGSSKYGDQPEEEAAASNTKEENENVRLLQEKLSAALISVSLKDELVKQHTKVAEEAVAGWEKAEDEVASLKQQLDTTVQQNSTLEARLGNLDQALKECVRQLRMEKEKHDQNICEALAEKSKEFEVSKLKLENKILELQTQLEACNARPPVKLEFLERENQRLKNELMSQSEEFEIMTIERDLCTKAAEAASKQNLEGIKMVAKLESECRKLKALSHKSHAFNKGQIQKSPSISSYSIDSVTNSSEPSETIEHAGSDSWATALMVELDQFKNDRFLGKIPLSNSVKIDLMDDFLEMEKLAALPENGHLHADHHVKLESAKQPSIGVEIQLREELRVVNCRVAELEETVQKLEAAKAELEMDSAQTQLCWENSQVEMIENKIKLEGLEAELQETNELKIEFESYANDLKLEAQAMMSKIQFLHEEIDRQRVSSEKLSARCQELEYDLAGKNKELKLQQDAASRGELEESQKRVNELQIQIKEALMNLEKQSLASRIELDGKEKALSETRKCLEDLQIQLKEAAMKLEKLEIELDEANKSKECLTLELASAREEVGGASVQIDTLRVQIDKEQAISAELSTKFEELKKVVKQMEQQNESVHIEQKINQADVASAAGKLAECQKTITSLGNQLKSLATLEDFFMETANVPKFSVSAPQIINGADNEMRKLHQNNVSLTQKKCDGHLQDPQEGILILSKYIDNDMIESKSKTMLNYSSSNGNGYEKLFPMRRS